MPARKPYTPDTTPTEYLGKPQDFTIPRDGDRDLAFSGWRLSRVEECREARLFFDGAMHAGEHCVVVSVYLAESGRLVADIERFDRAGDSLRDQEHTVKVFGPESVSVLGDKVVEWLKEDNRGRLGETSKRAWVEACATWPALGDEAVEHI